MPWPKSSLSEFRTIRRSAGPDERMSLDPEAHAAESASSAKRSRLPPAGPSRCAPNGATTRAYVGSDAPSRRPGRLAGEDPRRARCLQARLHPDVGRRPVRELQGGHRPALLHQRLRALPLRGAAGNVWGETDKTFDLPGHRVAAKMLASRLIEEGFDTAYAYKPLHHPLGHAFTNAVMYLDYARKGFDYPIVPFAINCYGRRVLAQRGGLPVFDRVIADADLDPPAPTPRRLFDLGAATARILAESPYRVALLASSGWSHAFLTAKNHFLYPDTPADRRMYDALCAGDWQTWRNCSGTAVEDSGQQEILNWMCLAGALSELKRKPHGDRLRRYLDLQFVESVPDRAAELRFRAQRQHQKSCRRKAGWHVACSALISPVGVGAPYGYRRVHSDREQRLADFHELAAIYADLRAQQADRAEGRALRARFCPVDDQAARLRRQERVLGPQSRILHPDGRTGRGHRAHPALCLGGGADPAAADRGAHGLDHRFDLERPLRHQHRLGLGQDGVRADGPVAGRGALRQALRLQHRIRHHPARALGKGLVRLQGRVLPDDGLQAEPRVRRPT